VPDQAGTGFRLDAARAASVLTQLFTTTIEFLAAAVHE
jgi:hypothetical protein